MTSTHGRNGGWLDAAVSLICSAWAVVAIIATQVAACTQAVVNLNIVVLPIFI
jgi:hypothetical protein